MKSLSTSSVARGARALAGAVAALLVAAGGATAASPEHSANSRADGHEAWAGHNRHLRRHHAPRWVRHRHTTRHTGLWHHRAVR